MNTKLASKTAPKTRQRKPRAPTPPPPPTTAELAAALGVSTRRISQLKKLGLPTGSIGAALEWRKANHSTDSAETLRQERIKLVQEQRQKIALENSVRRKELVDVATVEEGTAAIGSVLKAAFLKMQNDLPPILEGLEAAEIKIALKRAHNEMFDSFAVELDRALATSQKSKP
ncbi:MAG: hypothetical protein NTW21_43925 [Verrucomicrobia bacterium]|nr:hypothetical protein [Verrucomicrobiota bacterium]